MTKREVEGSLSRQHCGALVGQEVDPTALLYRVAYLQYSGTRRKTRRLLNGLGSLAEVVDRTRFMPQSLGIPLVMECIDLQQNH